MFDIKLPAYMLMEGFSVVADWKSPKEAIMMSIPSKMLPMVEAAEPK